MSATVLVDDEARNRIRSDLFSPLFVEAGAGTGKTTELVRRIVAVIGGRHATIDQIAAITFTEAAAAELRERVRAALEMAVATSTGAEASACRVALDRIDEASIHTIHAFCQRLLQTFPLAAGLPPAFEVVDSISASLVFERRFSDFLDSRLNAPESLGEPEQEVLHVALVLGIDGRRLRQLTAKLAQSWHLLTGPTAASSPAPRIDARPVVAMLDEALGRRNGCSDDTDKLAVLLDGEVRRWHTALMAVDHAGRDEAIRLFRSIPKMRVTGRAPNWQAGCRDVVRERLEAAEAECTRQLQALQTWACDGLVNLLSTFVLEGVQQRRAAGTLEFHDLLVLTRRLLTANPSVLRSIASRYRFLFIDEFQDTDPLQADIASQLAVAASEQYSPGFLFTVGDPKQSIYRFRGADIGQYLRFRSDRITGSVALQTNFRTLPDLVGWVNDTFESVLGDASIDSWQPLFSGRAAVDGPGGRAGGSVTVLGREHPGKAMRALQVRELEAEDIAGHLRKMHDERWAIAEGGGLRPVRFADMAVLMPTRVSLPALERALRTAAIPYRIESRSLVWSTQEVRDVLALLRAIEDHHDDVAVVATLRSVYFGCSDRDLLEWRAAGGTWNSHRITGPSDSVVAEGMAYLASVADLQWTMTVPELCARIMQDRRMFEMAFVRKRQRESWSRLRFVVDQARAWSEAGGTGLRAFLEWVEEQTEFRADAVETVVPEPDDDAVRILTIHAAKGLEYPVVALTGLNSSRSESDSVRVHWAGGRPEIRIAGEVDYTSSGFNALAAADRLEQEAEQRRLLYVGATRARDHLVVSVHRPEKRPCLAATLADAIEGVRCPDAIVRLDDPGSGAGDENRSELHVAVDRNPIARSRALVHGRAVTSLSATKIRARLGSGAAAPAIDTESVADPDRLALGRAVHLAMEHLPFADAGAVVAAAEAASAAERIDDRVDDVARCLRNAMQSSTIREAQGARRSWREFYVSGAVRGVAVEGVIDLLYETNDGLVVIDYKTDGFVGIDEAQALLQQYRWQLVTYAALVQQTLGMPVIAAGLLLMPPDQDRATTLWLDDLADDVGAFSRRVETLLTD